MDVAECLIVRGRTMVEYGPTHVDNTDAISMELAAQQAAKSFSLTVYFSKPGSPLRRPAEGQVGFIRTGERIPNSPGGKPHYAVTPATAKRCLWKDDFEAVLAHAYLPWERSSFVSLRFSDFNWRQTLADRVCIRGENPRQSHVLRSRYRHMPGGQITSFAPGITSEAGSFQMVRSDFNYYF